MPPNEEALAFEPPIFDYLLLKLAARCNLNCTYCYWFRDRSVYERAKRLTPEAEAALLAKLEAHLARYELKRFSILFHGGEPLLFGKRRFLRLVDALGDVGERTGCEIDLSITTNGVLIDDEWAALLNVFDIATTISIDGPKHVHDASRVDLRGGGTYDRVVRGIETLRSHGIEPGILAVCDPASDPAEVVAHLADTFGFRHFDILVPDATHDDTPPSIAPYFRTLFDLWFDEYAARGVEIRYLRAMVKGLLGGDSHLESIGFGPIQTCALLTGGELEPLDVLRIAGYRSTSTQRRIQTHTFQDLTEDSVWRRAFDAALHLSDTCLACEYRQACGGGFLPHRWSQERGYDNPSVYCSDLKDIFGHIWKRISPEIALVTPRSRIRLVDAIGEVDAPEPAPSGSAPAPVPT